MSAVKMPLMVIRNIVVCFGALRAVDDVSIDLPPGTTIGLIGPNGAGKTTFINAISGFVQTTGGSIQFCGDDEVRAVLPNRLYVRYELITCQRHVRYVVHLG